MRFQSPKTPSFNQFEINAATLCQVRYNPRLAPCTLSRACASSIPPWPSLVAEIDFTCVSLQGDFFRPIVLEVLDWKKNGQHKLLGQAKTSPDEILRKGSGYRVKIEGTSVSFIV